MAGQLGDLVIRLALDIANLRSDLGKASAEMNKFFSGVDRSFGTLRKGLGALGAGLGIHEIIEFTKQTTDLAEQMSKLSESTGLSVEQLQDWKAAAQLAGVSNETFTEGVNKLTRNLSEAAAGNKEMATLFRKMGIDVIDAQGNVIKTADALDQMARKFPGWADGPNKTAIAWKAFGRSAGPEFVPFMNEAAKSVEETNKRLEAFRAHITALDARRVKELGDQFKFLGIAAEGLSIRGLAPLADKLTNIVGQIEDLGKKERFEKIESGFKLMVDAIALVADSLSPLKLLHDLLDKLIKSTTNLAKPFGYEEFLKKQPFIYQPPFKPEEKPQAPLLTAAERAERLMRIQFGKDKLDIEEHQKDLERAFKREEDSWSGLGDFLQVQYSRNLIAISEYYDTLSRIEQKRATDALKNIDEQEAQVNRSIDVVKRSMAAAQKITPAEDVFDPVPYLRELSDLNQKTKDLEEQRTKIIRESGLKQGQYFEQSVRDQRQYAQQRLEVQQQYLEQYPGARVGGFDAGQIAQSRFRAQYEELTTRAQAEHNTELLRTLDTLEAIAGRQGAIDDLMRQAALLQRQLAVEEGRAQLAVQNGQKTTIEGQLAIGEAREREVIQLRAIADAADRAATSPEQRAAIAEFRLQIDQLAASVNTLENLFKPQVTDAMTTFFDDIVTGSKSAKQALLDFGNAIDQMILKVIEKNIAEKITNALFNIGDRGQGGFISKALAVMFNTGGGGGAGAIDYSMQSGGPVYPGRAYLVGESGPEVFMPHKAGQIIPAGAGGNISINVNVPRGTDRRNAEQTAALVGESVTRAMRRLR